MKPKLKQSVSLYDLILKHGISVLDEFLVTDLYFLVAGSPNVHYIVLVTQGW